MITITRATAGKILDVGTKMRLCYKGNFHTSVEAESPSLQEPPSSECCRALVQVAFLTGPFLGVLLLVLGTLYDSYVYRGAGIVLLVTGGLSFFCSQVIMANMQSRQHDCEHAQGNVTFTREGLGNAAFALHVDADCNDYPPVGEPDKCAANHYNEKPPPYEIAGPVNPRP